MNTNKEGSIPEKETLISRPRACDYAIYKDKGAMQFKLRRPTLSTEPNVVSIPGCIMIEAANALEGSYGSKERVWNWSNKIFFKLSAMDIAKVIAAFNNGKGSIFHDPYMKTQDAKKEHKVLEITKGKTHGYFFSLTHTKSDEDSKNTISVAISEDEAWVLKCLLVAAVPTILGWTN